MKYKHKNLQLATAYDLSVLLLKISGPLNVIKINESRWWEQGLKYSQEEQRF